MGREPLTGQVGPGGHCLPAIAEPEFGEDPPEVGLHRRLGDLVSVWHLLDATQRNVVRARLNPGEVQWRRGMAWAFEQAVGLVWYYEVSKRRSTRPSGRSSFGRSMSRSPG